MDNLIEAIPDIIVGTKGGANNIRSLHIKTAESTSFAVYEAKENGAVDETYQEEYSSQEEEDEA